MKNCKLFLLMVILFTSLVFSMAVDAAAEKSTFDYSAEKMIQKKRIETVICLQQFLIWTGALVPKMPY